ncbi:MAG: helix-turn-helix transcriptional regulator [Prevotella sp.]|nr:helix-turn-helix transcriptional regulator [Prevotella sp.]
MAGATAAAENREGKNVSNTELAQRMGLSQSTVSRLISGRQTLTVQHLFAFADALKVSVHDLLE